jgi:hypothetical protein
MVAMRTGSKSEQNEQPNGIKKMTNMFDPYKYPNCIDLDVKCEHEFLTIRENYSRTDLVPEAYHGQKGKVIKSVFPKAFITGSASFLLEFENEERMWISSLSVQEYMFPWEKKKMTHS